MSTATSETETANYVIRAEGFGSIDTLLRELDVDPKVAFAQVGLTPDILKGDNKNQNIEYRRFLDLLNYCADITGRKDFGNLLSYYQDMTVNIWVFIHHSHGNFTLKKGQLVLI